MPGIRAPGWLRVSDPLDQRCATCRPPHLPVSGLPARARGATPSFRPRFGRADVGVGAEEKVAGEEEGDDLFHRGMPMTANSQDDLALNELRSICLALPEAVETGGVGNPSFKVRDKIFAMRHQAHE